MSGPPVAPARRLPGAARSLATGALVLVLLTLAAYEPLRHNGFLFYDDEDYITRNTVVKSGLTLRGVALAFTSSYAANWFPLTWLSHMLDVELFGLDPRGHHLTSFAIHTMTALLLFATLRAMTGRAGPSCVVAALFAVHPLHVESVAWASERKDVLCALFWVLAMAAHLRYARRPSAGRYLATLLCLALALMAKPMAVTLPIALLLLDLWPLGRHRSSRPDGAPPGLRSLLALALEKLPLLALSALSALITLRSQAAAGAVHSLESFPLDARVANAVLSYVRYLVKTAWPADLAVFYPFTAHPLSAPLVLAAAALLAAIGAAALLLRDRLPWLATGWLWYLVSLLPVIGLVQTGEQAMADRYTYLPLVGVFAAVAWSAAPGRPGTGAVVARAAAAAVVLAVLAGLTRRQVTVWHSDETLFAHAVRVTRDNGKALYSLAMARDAAGDREQALRLYKEAIRLQPGLARAHFSYALALDEAGRTDEALDELRGAVRALPSDPVIRTTLALVLSREGLDEEAIAQLRELIRLRPAVAEGYNNLAALLARRGEIDEATGLLRRALEIDPGYADARANLEALTGGRPETAGTAPPPPGVPSTHRGLFGGAAGK